MNILRMENPVMPYAWGSKTFIQDLLGDKKSKGTPGAELWMGAHPKASSRIRNGKILSDLNYVIAEDPADFLGTRAARAYNSHLPFLLKVLAAEQPLSIQVHPDSKQAKAGFTLENKLGIPLDADQRNYKDEFHKPELLVALTEFHAMCGFRSFFEISRLAAILLPKDLVPEAVSFREDPHQKSLERLYAKLLSLTGSDKTKLLSAYLARLEMFKPTSKQEKQLKYWTKILAKLYPEDIGLVSPMFMNILTLQPLEGLFLDAGVLHSYLGGAGIEIMANSDNVLRGGLTPKHVDSGELLKVVNFTPSAYIPLKPGKLSNTEKIYRTAPEEFALSYILHKKDKVTSLQPSGSPEIVFCYEGDFTITNCSQILDLKRGQSLFIPYEVEGYTIQGKGRLFRARCNL